MLNLSFDAKVLFLIQIFGIETGESSSFILNSYDLLINSMIR